MSNKIRQVGYYEKMDPDHRQLLQELRDAVVELQKSTLPPGAVTNLTATPIPLGNFVQWTKSLNATRHVLYISNSPNRTASGVTHAVSIDVGDSNTFTDNVGQATFARFYWVQPYNVHTPGPITRGVKSITGVAGALVNPATQVPVSQVIRTDQTSNLPVSVELGPRGAKKG